MKYIYNILISIMFLTSTVACQDMFEEEIRVEDNGIELYAGVGQKYVVKAGEPNQFDEGTAIHIYGTRPGTSKNEPDDWSVNYMRDRVSDQSDDVKSTVVRGLTTADLKDGIRRIASMDEDNLISPVFQTSTMNLYGLAAVCSKVDSGADIDEIKKHNKQLEDELMDSGNDNVPQYNVSYNSGTESLPDVIWSTVKGLTPKYNSGRLTMPFKHTLAKLNFMAVMADDMDDSAIDKMTVVALEVKDYQEGLLRMDNGLYSRDEAAGRNVLSKPIEFVTEEQEVAVLENVSDPFGSCLIFPTTGATYDGVLGNETDESSSIAENHAVYVNLTVNITRNDGTGTTKTVFKDVKLTHYDNVAVFHPNCEYFITFTLTSKQAVVTLRPEYYEYIRVPVELGDHEVGEPIDFGGVLWSAANLGATSTKPTDSALEWEKSRGFYFQFGRNIPYYVRGSVLDPYPYMASYKKTTSGSGNTYLWDYEQESFLYTTKTSNKDVHIPYGNTVYGLDKEHGARAYPYIPALWEREIENVSKDKEKPTEAERQKGYLNFLKKARFYTNHKKLDNGQSAPSKVQSDPYEYINTASGSIRNFAYAAYHKNQTGYDRSWKKDLTQPLNWNEPYNNPSGPCPKGWRLPKADEFLSIFPASMEAGDIAFNPTNTNHTPPHPGAKKYTCLVKKDYLDENAFYLGILQDGLGNNGIKCDDMDIIQGWGTIYAIKRRGTADAYGVRWQIITADYDYDKKVAESGVNSALEAFSDTPKIGRGVLVISKYDLENKYDKSKISLRAVNNKVNGSNVAYKAESTVPQYICKGFVDNDGDNAHDSGETTFDIDWDKPSGQLYLPVPGYVIVPSSGGQALIYPGTEALYWTSTSKSAMTGVAVRIKYAGNAGSRYVYFADDESVANGAHVRCVRDTKAVN